MVINDFVIAAACGTSNLMLRLFFKIEAARRATSTNKRRNIVFPPPKRRIVFFKKRASGMDIHTNDKPCLSSNVLKKTLLDIKH